MKNPQYSLVPIHERPDLYKECCRIINAEWPASETRRLRSFAESCDQFPMSLVLLKDEKLIGHCKLSLIPSDYQSCFLGSVVIDYTLRSQGLGSLLLRGVEEYLTRRGFEKIFLTTKGQEVFYLKNGYEVCEPINIWNYITVPSTPVTQLLEKNDNHEKKQCFGPPPPPMPVEIEASKATTTSSKTYMVKFL